jgi:hypothetical protein
VFRKVEKRIHGAPSAKWAAASTGSDAHPHVSFTVFAARGLPINRKQEGPNTGTSVPFEASRDHRSQDAEIDVWENKTKFLWLWKCISQYQNDFSIHYGHPS